MVLVRIGNSFKGFVTVEDRRYCFEVIEDESCTNSILKADWRLKKLLGPSLNQFLKREFRDVHQFHLEFGHFVKANVKTVNVKCEDWLKNPRDTCALIKTLQEDLKSVSEYIKFIDIENKTVNVEVVDAQFRNHKAVLKLNQGYPKEPVKIIYQDLPLVKTLFNESKYDFNEIYTVTEFIKKFVALVNAFQDFWNIMSTIDLQCWVLDPPNPVYKDVFRRIKLSDKLSVGLTLNPLKPREMPEIKLFGCQSDVKDCKKILQKSLENELWDCEETLLYNLSNVLDVTIQNKMFAEEPDLVKLVQEEECAICFMWRLNDEIPNEMCETSTCRTLFHTKCLFTYLSSFPKNRESFGKIQGDCPNCDGIISCSVPKFN